MNSTPGTSLLMVTYDRASVFERSHPPAILQLPPAEFLYGPGGQVQTDVRPGKDGARRPSASTECR